MPAEKRGSNPSVAHAPDHDLVITRTFDAPRALVFDAWTKPEHLERWQGAPEGMTTTVVESDIRTGGRFEICMRAANGTEHWLRGEYREVTPPERLVFTHSWIDASGTAGKETLLTITFAERGKKTELTLRQSGFTSSQSRDGHGAGWSSTFDRLGMYIATLPLPHYIHGSSADGP